MLKGPYSIKFFYVYAADSRRGLVERLAAGEMVLCAEGYLLELARMGYLAHGVWVPEFLLETPEVLRTVHREFVHCGSDVTEAFQVRTPLALYVLFAAKVAT